MILLLGANGYVAESFIEYFHENEIDYQALSRADFDYTFLKKGIKDFSDEIEKQGEDKIVIVISTVFPGTIRKYIKV